MQGHYSGSEGGATLLLHLPSPGSALIKEDSGPLVPDPRTLSFRNSFARGQSQPVPGTKSEQPVPAPLPRLGLAGRLWGQLASRVRKVERGEGIAALPGRAPVGRDSVFARLCQLQLTPCWSPVPRTLGFLVWFGTDVASQTLPRVPTAAAWCLGPFLGFSCLPPVAGPHYLPGQLRRARPPRGSSKVLCL